MQTHSQQSTLKVETTYSARQSSVSGTSPTNFGRLSKVGNFRQSTPGLALAHLYPLHSRPWGKRRSGESVSLCARSTGAHRVQREGEAREAHRAGD
eukprot:1406944-Pyramimonas_sp.AAC.2